MNTRNIREDKLEALENLEKIARTIERSISGPFQYSGPEDDIDLIFLKLKAAIHELDRIEGHEIYISHPGAWRIS